MSKFDLHVHSKYSPDALAKPESIAKQALLKGLAGFAITDHNRISSFQKFKELQKQNKELLVIFGEEVKIIEEGKVIGELLCYFLQEEIKPASFNEIIDDAKTQGALVSIAHPFDFSRRSFGKELEIELKKVDAVEAFNARSYTASANKKAKAFVKKHCFPFTAGSDAHSLEEVGNAGLECSAGSEEELRKVVLKRECKIFSSEGIGFAKQWYYSTIARLGLKEK